MLMVADTGLGATGGQVLAASGSVIGSTAAFLATPAIGILPAIAGPIGLAIAGIASLLSVFGVGSGCGQSCIQASNDANAIEQALKANLAAFQSGQISQSQAEANFQTLWLQLQEACAQIGGDAGKNCISDRQDGACKWKDSSGNCFNWFTGYYSPIVNAAPANTISAGSVLSSLFAKPGVLGLALLTGLVLVEAAS